MSTRPIVGVSACLMGQPVRYDRGHKRSRFVTDLLAEHVDLRAVCPEMAIGLGVPREPIRLAQKGDEIRAVGTNDESLDVTDALQAVADKTLQDMPDLCGFVVMSKSPSCGMERVKVYGKDGVGNQRVGTGLFTRRLQALCPQLPIEEDGRLNDIRLRENFVQRVYVYARWQALNRAGMSRGDLVEFHAAHKYMLMAHGQQGYKELGQMLADLKGDQFEPIKKDYIVGLMSALSTPASRGHQTNVMQHLMGYLKDDIDAHDKQELVSNIDQYREGLIPLLVPLALLRHHFRKHPHPYVEGQHYLNPYPEDLMLRNPL